MEDAMDNSPAGTDLVGGWRAGCIHSLLSHLSLPYHLENSYFILGDKVEEALFGYKPSSQTHL
jgi:hypothetical protein